MDGDWLAASGGCRPAGSLVATCLQNDVSLWFYYEFTMSLLWVKDGRQLAGGPFNHLVLELNSLVKNLII